MEEFVPFDAFRAQLGAPAEGPGAADPADEAQRRRAYLAGHYRGAVAVHTFLGGDGVYVDCFTTETQPGARPGGTVATPPGFISGAGPGHEAAPGGPPGAGGPPKDRFGNVMACPPGSVPVRRVTPEQIARGGALENFFDKARGGGSFPPKP